MCDSEVKFVLIIGRFDDNQLAWFCAHGKHWEMMARTRPDIPQDAALTKKQRNWLLDLRSCVGIECLEVLVHSLLLFYNISKGVPPPASEIQGPTRPHPPPAIPGGDGTRQDIAQV